MYDVVHGDEVLMDNEDGETRLKVKSLLLDRQRPNVCQIFTSAEHKGSLTSSETKVWNCKINHVVPEKNSMTFNVQAIIGDVSQELTLKSVKSENSECTIC
jgi:hypothetical protein|tara:strand:+ start:307 stop:609 length:303 start_codon:yes stop_codon:yes gene_type:complete